MKYIGTLVTDDSVGRRDSETFTKGPYVGLYVIPLGGKELH